MDTISKRIIFIRKEAKLRKNKFASEIGISPSYVTQIELGKKIPSEHVIKVICFRFNVNEDWLREGIGDIYYQPPTINDLKPISIDQLKALASLAPKDKSPVVEESTLPSGLTFIEQIDVLKENRQLKAQLQEITDYVSQNGRKDKEERRKCVSDLRKIISIEKYRGEMRYHDENSQTE